MLIHSLEDDAVARAHEAQVLDVERLAIHGGNTGGLIEVILPTKPIIGLVPSHAIADDLFSVSGLQGLVNGVHDRRPPSAEDAAKYLTVQSHLGDATAVIPGEEDVRQVGDGIPPRVHVYLLSPRDG